MTLVLAPHDVPWHRLRVSHLTAAQITELLDQLPVDIEYDLEPDHDELAPTRGVRPAGYFGLAVALARRTWSG